jgi:hypothetical protein
LGEPIDVEGMLSGKPLSALSNAPGVEALRLLQRAVVVDVLDNLSLRDENYLSTIESSLRGGNSALLEDAPRNSILVRLCAYGRGRSDTLLDVVFPFFSSHIVLPLKPGEQVWVLFEDPMSLTGQGYWLSRITSPVDVEDANYTHHDRAGSPISPHEAKSFLDEDNGNKPIEAPNPGFPNGPVHVIDDKDRRTLMDIGEFDIITQTSLETNDFTIEPVPRFTKRPGDLVLQGSHNATIVLGTDRGYQSHIDVQAASEGDSGTTESNAHLPEPLKPGHGSIDIVAGRGMYGEKSDDPDSLRTPAPDLKILAGSDKIKNLWTESAGPEDLIDPTGSPNPKGTESKVVQNSRGTFETGKNLSIFNDKVSNARSFAAEGDPNFEGDASRIYLTMQTEVDDDFSLEYPKFISPPGEPSSGADGKPSAVLKSDEIRIIGRQAGSIRIVKEGEVGDDQCVITLLADGTVAIDAKKIIIGDGRDSQTFLGNEATEPLILGDKLVAAFEAFATDSLLALTVKATGNLGAPLAMPEWPKVTSDLVQAIKAALSPHAKTK